MFKQIIISCFLVLSIRAQTITFNDDSTVAAIENNRVYFPLKNNGILAAVDDDSISNLMTYDGKGVLFSGGFFLSGYKDTTLWASASASSLLIQDFQPGTVGSILDNPQNKIYAVRKSDPPFGDEWENWQNAVEQGAYFYDGDNNGLYDPVDKNGNGQWDLDEDKPDILYDVSLFTVYRDDINPKDGGMLDRFVVGVEVRQTIFASKRNTILDDVIFIRYSLLYKGLGSTLEPDSLTDVVFSIWSDCDIGDSFETSSYDLSGCDTLLHSGFTYNDSLENSFSGSPPSVFKTILQGPLVKSNNLSDIGYNRMGPDLGAEFNYGYKNLGLTSYIFNTNSSVATDSPNNENDARNYMLGLTKFGNQLNPCDWYFGEVRGDIDCSNINPLFWVSGDPTINSGWLNSRQDDYKDLISSGKFILHKNEPMDIIVAYTVGRGTDALNSITVARETVEYIHEEYERNFSTIVGIEDEEKEELVRSFTLYQNYPNPFNPTTTIKFQIGTPPVSSPLSKGRTKGGFVTLKVYNILGEEINTLLSKHFQPAEYEIEFDASDLPSGVYFYRLNSGKFSDSRKMLLLK